MSPKRHTGFSLVELLITLAIMGVIATFAVPPLFQVPASRSSTKYSAMNRDVAFMVLTAFEQYKAAHSTVPTSTTFGAITPYMNYVATDNSTTIDSANGFTTATCGTGNQTCLKLHNGAMMIYRTDLSFGGSNTTNALFYWLDPDGQQTDATTNGPGKSVVIWLQYNGTIHSWGTLPATVYDSGGPFIVIPSTDPIWFNGL